MSIIEKSIKSLAVIIVSIIGYLGITVIISLIIPDSVITASVSNIIIIAIIGTLRWKHPPQKPDYRPMTQKMTITLVICAIVMIYAGQSVAKGLRILIGDANFAEHQQKMMNTPIIIVMIFSIILAPIAEEFLIRGMLLPKLRRYWSPTSAIIITTLVFSGLHGNMTQFAGTLALGLITGWTYEYTGRIIAPIIVHCGFNTLAAVTPSALFLGSNGTQLIVSAVVLIVTSIGWMMTWKHQIKSEPQ